MGVWTSVTFPIVTVQNRRLLFKRANLLNNYHLSSHCLSCNLKLPCDLFHSKLHIVRMSLSHFFFPLCATVSMLYYPEIPSTKQISPLLFKSAYCKFSGHDQNAATFFARTQHKWPLSQVLIRSLLFWKTS